MPTASAISSVVRRPDQDAAAADIWVRLTQEDVPAAADEATLRDLYQMLAAAMAGESAYEYVYDSCPYVVIVDGVVRITLPFFTWPSDPGLAYDLTASYGSITPGVAYEEFRSFDVVFDHAAEYDMETMFEGTFTPQMPFFAADGREVSPPEIIVDGSRVILPEPLTVVLRAEGKAFGFRHELHIEVSKVATDPADPEAEAAVAAITSPESAITAAWIDEDGAAQNDILDMQIPGCVADLLETCPDGDLKGDPQRPEDIEVPTLYYSTCDGAKLAFRMEKP